MSVSIRRARIDDVDVLRELWVEFVDFHKAYDSFFSRAKNGHERFADFVRENINNPEWLVLLAAVGDQPIGYCMSAVMAYPPVFETKLYGFIQDIAVTESHRRHGAGSQLLEETLRWFRKQGVTRIEVQVATANPISQAFWRRHGFNDYITRLMRHI